MRQYTKEEKSRWLMEWDRSGQSAKSFSKGRPFSASSLRYWKSRQENPLRPKSGFIEVISSPGQYLRKYTMTFPTGVKLEMDELPGIEELKKIIAC